MQINCFLYFLPRSLATSSIAKLKSKTRSLQQRTLWDRPIVHSAFRLTNSIFNCLKQRRQRELIEIAISLKYAVLFFKHASYEYDIEIISAFFLSLNKCYNVSKRKDCIIRFMKIIAQWLWYKIFQVPYSSKSPLTR